LKSLLKKSKGVKSFHNAAKDLKILQIASVHRNCQLDAFALLANLE